MESRPRQPGALIRRWVVDGLLACGCAAFASGAASGCGSGARTRATRVTQATRAPATAARSGAPPVGKLLGQRIMVGFQGTRADPALLGRVRAGQVGAVILFADNIQDRAQVQALTGALQGAARAGGNPPLLIAVDQEGGEVKRFANGPPQLSPPQMPGAGIDATYRAGRATGNYLRGLGLNLDLAPVLDVPTSTSSFIWQQRRAFSFSAPTVARYAQQFAAGLQSGRVAATGKHFPGVGSAGVDTDNRLDELHPTRSQRDAALTPYRALIDHGLDVVMVATAGFPAYDPSGAPAALSAPIIRGLLRTRLHFQGVTITDALESPTGHDPVTAGVLAARAGADLLLYTNAAAGELAALERALRAGQITRADALAAYQRIVALKRRLGAR